ncbi:MAG TPA: lasso peptide biosynthesis protein [Trinickia sp.]|uniref:lasso peptide biosynthesis protein n=1 Tax=Trinickia sp. TaxID=2571163 RepID=UPI002B5BAAC3|nr:lasso peptide biosynthesis protein [Trinickia sp.]HTI19155.1 lasso peptide biosynthesis protein [Trinickia sp.]
MNNERRLIFLLHSVIRALLLERSVDDAYLAICKTVMPGIVMGQFTRSTKIDSHYLQTVCDFIYQMDNQEWSYASCYSASIVAQLIASANNIDSDIIIGIKKQDGKISGHAWVQIRSVHPKQIISPGRVSVDDLKVIKRLHPEKALQSWMQKRAILDAAVEP